MFLKNSLISGFWRWFSALVVSGVSPCQVGKSFADEITEPNVREAMQAIAPATENGLYLVPKVID